MLFLIILLCIVAFFLFFFRKKQVIALGTITLCTGAVKTGKSTLAVYLALRTYKRVLFRYKIVHLLNKKIEKPLLYSNIPLRGEYVPVSTEMLLRKVRIVPKSIVLLDEASLIADSQFIRDNKVNMQLLKFFKLFGHYSHGGTLIIDTQSISDLHYAIKRCLNSYIYIYNTFKYIPFFLKMKVLEQRYSDDGSVISTQSGDVTENLKTLIVPKSIWRKFDCYCYSSLSDGKPVYKKTVDNRYVKSLKTSHIPSFRDWSDGDTLEGLK